MFGGVEGTEDVHLEDPLQVTAVDGRDGVRTVGTARDAGVAEEDVELAVSRDGSVDGGFDVFVVGDVAVNIGNVVVVVFVGGIETLA